MASQFSLEDLLARIRAGEQIDFDALQRAHPEHRGVILRLRDLADALRSQGQNESFAERLRKEYGEGVDPGVSLGGDGGDDPGQEDDPSSEFLNRLRDRAGKRSRYKLKGEVARGGMGAILRVWDEDLRRQLAMKVILGREERGSESTPGVDNRVLARFLEEAQVTGQLDHPGIVPVHELGIDADGRVFFTMKLVKGRDLKAIYDLVFEEKEGWSQTRALGVLLKVCEALAYSHSKGVIHRDLKPANVMVGNFGEVYVMDWGLARVIGRNDAHDIRIRPETSGLTSVKTERRDEREREVDSPLITMDGLVMGTPAYMSPEQARGEVEKLSPRSDVYAVGAMLYHLLAKQAPYMPPGARLSNRTVLACVVDGPPRPLHEIDRTIQAELAAICDKAMARDSSHRYADTLAIRDDLRAFLEGHVVRAYEAGSWAEARKWITRNRGIASASAAALFFAFVAMIAVTWSWQRAEQDFRTADATLKERQAAIQQADSQLTLIQGEIGHTRDELNKLKEEAARSSNVALASRIENVEQGTHRLEGLANSARDKLDVCQKCKGTGTVSRDCAMCSGGRVVSSADSSKVVTCVECRGAGRIVSMCEVCGGTGAVLRKPVGSR